MNILKFEYMISIELWQYVICPILTLALAVIVVKIIIDAIRAYKNFKDLDKI